MGELDASPGGGPRGPGGELRAGCRIPAVWHFCTSQASWASGGLRSVAWHTVRGDAGRIERGLAIWGVASMRRRRSRGPNTGPRPHIAGAVVMLSGLLSYAVLTAR